MWSLLIFLVSVAIAVGIGINFLIQKLDEDDELDRPPKEIIFGNEYEDETCKFGYNFS